LRICEYDTYKAVYCGLCKELGRSYGFVLRFTLSYDFAFLSMLSMAYNDGLLKMERQRCIAHPFKKTMCAVCGEDFTFPAAAAVLSVYHKLSDDKFDKGLKSKIRAVLLLPILKKHYKKAALKFPVLAEKIEAAMQMQREIEEKASAGIDIASEPTALIMKAVAGEISSDLTEKRILERFGYFLGRYVYLCDAVDDIEEDLKKNNYNPLILKEITMDASEIEIIKNNARESINMTLSELSNAYILMSIKKYKTILDNIIYLGLKNTFEQIIKKDKEKTK
jgi:hypothetical protein